MAHVHAAAEAQARQAERLARCLETHKARLNVAQSPGERLSAAADFLKAVLAKAPGQIAAEIARTTAQALETTAEQTIRGLRPGGDTP